MGWHDAADMLEEIEERRTTEFLVDSMMPILGIRSQPQPPEDGEGWRSEAKRVRIIDSRIVHTESKLTRRRDPASRKWRFHIRCTCGWSPQSQSSEAKARAVLKQHVSVAL